MAVELTLKEVLENISKYWPKINNKNGNWEKCFEYCLMAARMGDGGSMANTAWLYENGHGIEQNGREALYWAKEGAKAGNKVAICHLARYYENGKFTEEDFAKAQEYYKLAGDKGYAQAYGNLACMYADGRGCEPNFGKAAVLWLKAYKMGEQWVAKYLCECYIHGYGVERNLEKARFYLAVVRENMDDDGDLAYDLEIADMEEHGVKMAEGEALNFSANGSESGVKYKELPKYDTEFVLHGHNTLTKYFNEEIIDFFRNMDAYEEMGIHSVPATLLYGPPGCGKTFAVNKMAKYLKLPVFEINSSTVADTYVHGTAKKIAKIFEEAREKAPSVLIIDEFETYVGRRDPDDWKSKIEETDEFLRNIGPAIDDKVIIFAMTNMPDTIDPAILRKGRFDNQIKVEPAGETEIMDVLKEEFNKTKADPNIVFATVAHKLSGHPLSDVGYLVKQAIRVTVRDGRKMVKQDDINTVLNEMLKGEETPKVPVRKHIGFQTDIINV
ncbi:MAG: AAA family ATPase [Phascolarctobacterium sp.]|nr:AAA family ATPase [Candidatus Phascolarctobacterium caballi]